MDILDYYNANLRGRGNGGWSLVAQVLGMSPSATGAAYEIAHGIRPINDRQKMMWEWWTEYQERLPELVEVNPKTHIVKPKPKPRIRAPRCAMGFDPGVAEAFRHERDRRGLTNTQYLAQLMGITSRS